MIKDLVKDPALVTKDGQSLSKLPHGVRIRPAVTHFDDRGSVCEMYDERWNWHEAPLTFTYLFTLRPQKVKGWGMHLRHDDRYFVIKGEMEVVMYDTREDSPTKGLLAKVQMTEWNRGLLCIPIGIWHANFNPGTTDAIIVNHPTLPYDHENPDKYRLPLDTDQIPYQFPPGVSGY